MNRRRSQISVLGLPRPILQYFPAQQVLKMLIREERVSPDYTSATYQHPKRSSQSTMQIRRGNDLLATQSEYDQMMVNYKRKLQKEKKYLLKVIAQTDSSPTNQSKGLLKIKERHNQLLNKIVGKQQGLNNYFTHKINSNEPPSHPNSLMVTNSVLEFPQIKVTRPLVQPLQPSLSTRLHHKRRSLFSSAKKQLPPLLMNELHQIQQQPLQPWK